MNLRKTKYIIGLSFILLGVGIVVATNLPRSMQYYLTVDELLAMERSLIGKELKVAGKVEPGSVTAERGALRHRFRVTNAGKSISVTFAGALPDTFKDGSDVVVTGTFREGRHLVATNVLAKCASKYEDKLQPGYAPSPTEGF